MNVADLERYLELKRQIFQASSVVGDLTIFFAALGRFPTEQEKRERLVWTRNKLQQLVAEIDALVR